MLICSWLIAIASTMTMSHVDEGSLAPTRSRFEKIAALTVSTLQQTDSKGVKRDFIGNAPVDELRLRSVPTPLRRATVVSFEDSGTNVSMCWRDETDVEVRHFERVKAVTLAAESFGIQTSRFRVRSNANSFPVRALLHMGKSSHSLETQ